MIRPSRTARPLRRLHAEDRGASLAELLVATVIGAMVMSVVATTIFTTNDLRKRADDRSQFAGDVSIASLSFDRDGAMATQGAPARAQTSSTSCATPIDLGFNEAGGNVRYRMVAGSPSGPSGWSESAAAGSRTLSSRTSRPARGGPSGSGRVATPSS